MESVCIREIHVPFAMAAPQQLGPEARQPEKQPPPERDMMTAEITP